MGPTASGKTELAMQLYDSRPCELISVDSALVYRGMNIGTAKPTAQELTDYPHHLIDICNPDEPYSASQFREDALALIAQAINKKHLPVLVGGTMLYYKTLMQGLADLPSADEAIRTQITTEAANLGWPGLHAELAEFDPDSAERIKPNDSQRIQRAIEVYRISGNTLTEFYAKQAQERFPYRVLNTAIAPQDRAILRDKIRQRFMLMLEQGVIKEVDYLLNVKGYDPELPAMRSVGYRQIIEYLKGTVDYDLMIENVVTATARLAKRQVTWLRSWPELVWFESGNCNNLAKLMTLL